MFVTVIDTVTKEIIVEKKEYMYVVRPAPSMYSNDVLLHRTIQYMVESRYMQRLINMYSKGQPKLIERLNQPNWGVEIDVLSTDFF